MEKLKQLAPAALLTLAILAALIFAIGRGRDRIVESLKALSPLFLALTFVFLVVLLAGEFKNLIKPFAGLTSKSVFPLGALCAAAFALAFFVGPRTHRIYYDENIYLHVGQTIAASNTAQMVNFGEIRDGRLRIEEGEYNKQPNAYPFVLSVLFRIFGRSEAIGFLFNNSLFAFSVLMIFGIGFLLCDSPGIGLYAAAVFAVIPQNILWHNTTSVEPSATASIVFTVLVFLVFLKTGRSQLFLLAAVAACFGAQFRLESALIFPLLGILAVHENPKAFRQAGLVYAIPLSLFLLVPHFLHLYCFQGHPWGGGADKLSLAYFRSNLRTNGLFFLNNKDFPVLFTVFILIALFGRGLFKVKLKLLVWFLFFWGVFLFFYAGSYHYGADVRFALMAFPPFSVLAGIGMSASDGFLKKLWEKGRAVAGVILLPVFLMFLPLSSAVGDEAWAARADHRFARTMCASVPEDGIVFTHNPNMFLFWGKSAAQASLLAGSDETGLAELRRRFPGGLYFHYNFWCNVDDPLQTSFCRGILAKFPHREILAFQERTYSYVLYRIE